MRPGCMVRTLSEPALGCVRSGRPIDVGTEGRASCNQAMMVVAVMPADVTWRIRPRSATTMFVLVLVGTRVCWLYDYEVAEC